MVRIMNAAVYVRPWDGGLLWGVFEDDPLAVDVETREADVDMGALGLDADVLWRAVADVERQLPILRELPLRSISPPIGEELAAWIVDGAPTRDLSPLAPGRFAAAAPPPEALERDAVWQYRHFYGSA